MSAQEWAPVVPAAATSISAIAASVSAIAAHRTASKTSKAAETANSALAMALRPTFALGIGGPGEHRDGCVSVRVRNTGAFDAINVTMALADESGKVVDSRAVNRVRDQQPGVWASEDNDQTLFAPMCAVETSETGKKKRQLFATVRCTDDHGLQRWEQQIDYVWELTRVGERDELRKYPILGEPRKINDLRS